MCHALEKKTLCFTVAGIRHLCCAQQHTSPHAVALAEETGSEQLCDLHIFTDAQRVVAALRQRNCAPALAWCAENRARLRRIKSSLELQLRLREFLELVHAVRLALCMCISSMCDHPLAVAVVVVWATSD
jgi:CTLH/CRA C-terminal to LisH motif domain